ncbi:MAG: hypothetical protein FIB07_17255 [Candidatus Methanoperedens sp.]|nr:hypothetical protein [Candidatus Methanoperedens sp.]
MDGSNYFVFWSITLSAAILIILQINCTTDKSELKIIYAEIVVLFGSLQLISITNAGMNNLYWLDSSFELRATLNIIEAGWNPDILGTVGPYPAIHFFGAILSQITGVELVNIARWMGLLMHGMALLFYLMFGRYIFKNNQVSLLSGLSFIFLFYYTIVTGFGRVPLSIALFFLILFLIFRNAEIPKIQFTGLVILSCFTLLFAHPLAPVVLAAFLIFYLVVYRLIWITKTFSLKSLCTVKKIQIDNIRPKSITFILLLLISIAAYFLFISNWSQNLLHSTVTIMSGSATGQPIGTGTSTPLNWRIFLYGQGIMGLIFGFLILRSQKAITNFYSVFLCVFSCFLIVWSFIAYSLKIEFLRFTIFIWPFMLLAVSYAIVSSKHHTKLSYLMIVFIIINISGYYPDVYNKSAEPRYSMGEWRQYTTVYEKISVSNFDTFGNIIGNHYLNMAFLYLKGKTINIDTQFYIDGFRKPNDYSFFYFEDIDRQRIYSREGGGQYFKVSNELYSEYQKTISLLKVYVNGNVEIYKISRY